MPIEDRFTLILANELFPDNPEKQREFIQECRENYAKWDNEFRPFEEELKRSMILTAADYRTFVSY